MDVVDYNRNDTQLQLAFVGEHRNVVVVVVAVDIVAVAVVVVETDEVVVVLLEQLFSHRYDNHQSYEDVKE